MANQRVLDDNENDKSTKDGASDHGSHHDDMLGHILEDISLDEWDVAPDSPQSVAPPDIVVREIAMPDVPDQTTSVSDIQDVQLPDDDWAPSEIVAMPETMPAPEVGSTPEIASEATTVAPTATPENASPSLFDFSMMQKFGSLDTVTSEAPTSFDTSKSTEPNLETVAPLLVPAPPVAIGPNPFAIKTAPAVETPIPELEPEAKSAPLPAFIPSPAPEPLSATPNPGAANTRIPALAPTPAMIFAQAHAAPTPSPIPAAPPAVPPVSTAPASNGATSAASQPKRKPAATLIFDSFTKSKIEAAGIDLLDPFNLNAKTPANPAAAAAAPPKQRATARTLIFKAGEPVDEMEEGLQQLTTPASNVATTTGTNPTVSVNPSVGPNLAAAIAAYQAVGPAPAAMPVSEDAAPRANSNVIPAHPASGGRPIARTMILKSLAKPEPNELAEPVAPQDGRPSAETIIAAGHAAEAAEAQAAEAGRPKIAKRSTAPTLIFKAFTLPSAEENAKPAPLKIIRYDSSKLRNLETNVKPLSIAGSIAAAKQASLTDNDKNDNRPAWLKLVTANPLLKSQKFRSAALLIILSSALFVCSTALVKSLYSDGQDYHPTNVTAAARDQHHYKSTDGGKSFDILDKDKGSVLIVNGKAIHGKVKTVSDADLISLATSSVPKREIWLQKTDAGYVDQDGTILYSASAPELTIAKKIDNYVSILQAKYKETKLYPSDAERFERMSPKDFRYTNPFTGHVDQPSVQYKRFAAADTSWTDHAKAGHGWAEEPAFKPGTIHCVCLDYCRFFIHAFDRNGQPLYGSVPGVADYVELKDGTNMNPRRNDKVTDDKDRTPAVFTVSRNPALQMEVALVRQVGWLLPATLIVVALLAGGWMLFLRRMKNNKADSIANTSKFITK